MLYDSHCFEEIERVFTPIVGLTHGSKYLSLHSSAHHPERISDTVAYNATDDCRDCVEAKAALLEVQGLSEETLKAFIHGEVHGVKSWRAHGCHRVTSV